MNRILPYVYYSTFFLILSSCGTSDQSLTGTIMLSGNTPVPEGSILILRMVDDTSPGGETVVAEERTILNPEPGATQVPFTFPYEASDIQHGHRYTLRASLLVNGQLTWLSPVPIQVLPAGTNSPAILLELSPM